MMNYLSVCSGIEAASVAWKPLGWKPIAFSEIEPFPSSLLAHHYPDVPNLGDMNNFRDWNINGTIDLICGGTPCQAFSIAGQRQSLKDDRGNLSLTFCQLCDHFNPEVVLWENVPGVLNTKDNAFGCFLAELAGLDEPVQPRNHPTKFEAVGIVNGQKRLVAWRVLDAQYFGVPQRRRRVFVVAFRGTGNWRSASALFPIIESVRGITTPSREKRKDTSTYAQGSFATYSQSEPGATLKAEGGDLAGGSETLVVHGSQDPTAQVENAIYFNGDTTPKASEELALTLRANQGGEGVGVAYTTRDVAPTLTTGFGARGVDADQVIDGGAIIHKNTHYHVRKLTPKECERLQGFPDNYTKIPYRGKPIDACPDSPRYKALGNSWAVPGVRWIGERINYVRSL